MFIVGGPVVDCFSGYSDCLFATLPRPEIVNRSKPEDCQPPNCSAVHESIGTKVDSTHTLVASKHAPVVVKIAHQCVECIVVLCRSLFLCACVPMQSSWENKSTLDLLRIGKQMGGLGWVGSKDPRFGQLSYQVLRCIGFCRVWLGVSPNPLRVWTNGCFLKWWYPTTMGFPKMIILGCCGDTTI